MWIWIPLVVVVVILIVAATRGADVSDELGTCVNVAADLFDSDDN